MELINIIEKNVEVNTRELEFLKYLSWQDEYDAGSFIGIPDIDIKGFSRNQIAGYISDLVRKHLIHILDAETYSFGCDCIHLHEDIIDQL